MSLSRETRLQNMDAALVTMYRLLDEHVLLERYFCVSQPEFNEIYPTTWEELEDRRLVAGRHSQTSSIYRLTGAGWLRAIAVTGDMETSEFKVRVGCLSAALKALVKGRAQRSVTHHELLCQTTGLPAGWIFNIIESEYWDRFLRRNGARFDHDRRMIWVPGNFGTERLL